MTTQTTNIKSASPNYTLVPEIRFNTVEKLKSRKVESITILESILCLNINILKSSICICILLFQNEENEKK